MEETSTIASKLYGKQEEPSSKSSTSVLCGGVPDTSPKQPAVTPQAQEPVITAAEKVYGDGTGTPLDDYGSVISPALDTLAFRARFDGDQEEAKVIDNAAREMNTIFKEYEVGGQLSRDIMAEASSYLTSQRSEDAIIETEENTVAALKEKYGQSYAKNIAGAQRVIREAARRVPNLIAVLERTGLGNSQKLIEGMVSIAKKRGYVN